MGTPQGVWFPQLFGEGRGWTGAHTNLAEGTKGGKAGR